MARIPPLPPDQWPPQMRDVLAALRPTEPRYEPPGRREGRPAGMHILGTLARHTALARAYHVFNGHVLFATTLSERQRELVVLRVAAVRRCEYEWRQHAVLAGDVGISPEELRAVVEGPDASGWEPLEAAVLRAVDELVAGATVSDDTWTTLAGTLSTEQLMDLVFTVGAYDLLAMAFGAFGIELDDDLIALVSPSPFADGP
jgi:AhpD family alkylhydroperoxidase